ncbi:MAG: glycosyltransferase family 2 protein [bacterium]|nr:glycosyltransferase family 2 protein [bacterium]
MKDINIVLLNYLTKDKIMEAVASLFVDIKNCSFDIQVTVCDNSNNQDGLKEELENKFPNALYINTGSNVGFGKGNNIGFDRTPARYYFSLNPDTVIIENSHTIESLIKFMDNNPKIGCIGPKMVNMDGTLQYSCYRFDLRSILIKPLKQINFDKKYQFAKKYSDRLLMKDFDHNHNQPVDWVLGAALLVRKEVVDRIGWYDNRFFMYLEDCDWCRRMWEAGFPVYYLADVVIKHGHARDSAKVPGIFKAFFKNKLARIHFVSWVKYLWKWRHNFKYYA